VVRCGLVVRLGDAVRGGVAFLGVAVAFCAVAFLAVAVVRVRLLELGQSPADHGEQRGQHEHHHDAAPVPRVDLGHRRRGGVATAAVGIKLCGQLFVDLRGRQGVWEQRPNLRAKRRSPKATACECRTCEPKSFSSVRATEPKAILASVPAVVSILYLPADGFLREASGCQTEKKKKKTGQK